MEVYGHCVSICLAVTLYIYVSICGCACQPGRPAGRPSWQLKLLFFLPVSGAVVCVANRVVPVRSSVLRMSLEFGSVKRCRWIVTETHFHVETCWMEFITVMWCLLAELVLGTPELKILPSQPIQNRPISQSMLLSCRVDVENKNLVTNLQWRDPSGRVIGDNSDRYVHYRLINRRKWSAVGLNPDTHDERPVLTTRSEAWPCCYWCHVWNFVMLSWMAIRWHWLILLVTCKIRGSVSW